VKKTIAISFLFIILLFQYGHLIVFVIGEISIERDFEAQILQNIPDASLDRIEDNNELSWEEEGREFTYQDKLYDVVRTKTEQGKKVYYALNDRKEKKLVDQFSRNMKTGHENADGTKSGKYSIKFQSALFTVPEQANEQWVTCEAEKKYFNRDSRIISNPQEIIPTPPWA
jgi:hypothetical protein